MSAAQPFAAETGALRWGASLAGLTPIALWTRYVGLGGASTPKDVASFISGRANPERPDYNLLVDAINEALTDVGLNSPVDYR